MTAKELIENNSLTNIEVIDGQTVVFTEIALTAVNTAKQGIKEKAIKAACNHCIQSGSGCGHIDREDDAMMYCQELEDFIKELNS